VILPFYFVWFESLQCYCIVNYLGRCYLRCVEFCNLSNNVPKQKLFRKLFLKDTDEAATNTIRSHERTGRALGSDTFLESLELSLLRTMKRQKAEREKKADK
jgi:hypothetical protein